MTLELRVFAHSEIGLVRKNNQDSGYASPTMLMVADGMGGAAAGDLASRIAIDELRGVDGQGQGDEMLDILDDATRRANDRLAVLIGADHELDGMGTTICGGLFDGADLGLVHIGDSRAYLMRGDLMIRLTHDHSWVQSLMDEGKLTGPQAFTHPHRSLLLRVLNGQPYSRPDLLRVGLKDGDRVMICSDGLCGLVDDPAIARGLALSDPQEALKRLIQVAHRAGGSDNITIIVADVFEVGPAPVPEPSGATAEVDTAAATAGPSSTGSTNSTDSTGSTDSTVRIGSTALIGSTPAAGFTPLTALLTSPHLSAADSTDPHPPADGDSTSPRISAGADSTGPHRPDAGSTAPHPLDGAGSTGSHRLDGDGSTGPQPPADDGPSGPHPADDDGPTSPTSPDGPSGSASPQPPTSPTTPVHPSPHPAPTAPPPRRPAQLRAALLAGDPVRPPWSVPARRPAGPPGPGDGGAGS